MLFMEEIEDTVTNDKVQNHESPTWGTYFAEDEVEKISRLAVISPQTQRRIAMAEIYFLDYYFDLITYLGQRKRRLNKFKRHCRELQLSEGEVEEQWKYYCGQERAFLRKRRTKVRFSEFDVLLQIGEGGYGQVFLCKKRDTKELCAVKRMFKRTLIQRSKVDNILIERDVLISANSPWLTKLFYSFQDHDHVYLAMEFVPGGDLRSLLNHVGSMREEPAKIYLAEMVVSMVTLHSLGYLHRDLKPENFLLDSEGHIKLTDFGLAKGNLSPEWLDELKKKLEAVKLDQPIHRSSVERRRIYQHLKKEDRALGRSFVGTPDYMAPELLKGETYDLLVDYWAIGVILFELLYGYTPFTAPTIDEIFICIRYHESTLERPVFDDEDLDISDHAWDLIKRLLSPRESRIGSLKEIQDHPFFAGLDWENLRNVASPFVPELDSPEDSRYFDKDELGDTNLFPQDANGNTTYARKAFFQFTYKHSNWQNTAMKKQLVSEVKQLAFKS